MTEIHQVKCNHCGIIKDLRLTGFGYHGLPLFWHHIDDISEDLCKLCYTKYKKSIERWMNE